jgi:SAM-dependent methyltransferase
VATPIEPLSFRWGAQPQEWTTYQETAVRPLYEAVFDQLGLTAGTRLLDVGCGAGLAARLGASRGARVWGLDASDALLEIARSRVPEGEFRLGDMAALPYAEASFDVVTGFNSFQFATDLVAVFGQVKRVIRPGGSVAVAVWGRPEECESAATVNAISRLVPDPRLGVRGPFALSVTGVVEAALTQAGLRPRGNGAVACPYTYPNLGAAVAGWLATGTAARAIQHIGGEAVRQAIIDSLPPYRTPDASYRQHNIFRYVIASP